MPAPSEASPAGPPAPPRVGLPEGAALEPAQCLFCPTETPVRALFDDPPFRVVRCTACGLVRVTPRVSTARLAEVYGESYWSSPAAKDYGYTDYRKDEPHWLRTYRRRVALFEGRLPPAGRVLDVGCAAGFFLRVMRERGHDVRGVELSPSIAGDARKHLGEERIHVGTLDDAPFREGSFDCITFWDVVEHLPDPAAVLRGARRFLTPGGFLLLETQDVSSLFARVMGRRWQHFKQTEHLYHFSPATIRRLLDQAGYRVERITHRQGGKYVGLDFIAERAGKVHPLLSRLLAPLARVRGFAPYVNLFDEMIVLARPAAPPGG